MPLLKKAATSQKLKNVLSNHLEDTRVQIDRLKMIFQKMACPAEGRNSEAILGITREARWLLRTRKEGTATRDAEDHRGCAEDGAL